MRTFYEWNRVLRLRHGLTAATAAWLVALLCTGRTHVPAIVWLASLAIGLSCVSASVFHYGAANRMYTRKGEVLSTKHPRALSLIGAIGFLLSLVIGRWLPFWAQLVLWYNAVAVACYARWLSRHWASKNLTIALVLISPVLIGWLTVGVWHPMLGYLLAAVFCGYLARELIKDIGDIRANCGLRVTLPIWLGVPGTIRVATVSLGVSVGVLVCLAGHLSGRPYAQACLALAVSTLGSTIWALARCHHLKIAERGIEFGHLWLMASIVLYRLG